MSFTEWNSRVTCNKCLFWCWQKRYRRRKGIIIYMMYMFWNSNVFENGCIYIYVFFFHFLADVYRRWPRYSSQYSTKNSKAQLLCKWHKWVVCDCLGVTMCRLGKKSHWYLSLFVKVWDRLRQFWAAVHVKPHGDMAVTPTYYALSVGLMKSWGFIQNNQSMDLSQNNTNKNWVLQGKWLLWF